MLKMLRWTLFEHHTPRAAGGSDPCLGNDWARVGQGLQPYRPSRKNDDWIGERGSWALGGKRHPKGSTKDSQGRGLEISCKDGQPEEFFPSVLIRIWGVRVSNRDNRRHTLSGHVKFVLLQLV
jgi:hypothetical protein